MTRPKPKTLKEPSKSPDPPARVLTDWKARAALFVLALLAYANSFSSGLVQDAKKFVTFDDRIRALTAANLRLIFDKTYWWPTMVDGLYRPVTTLSLLVNYAVLGNGQNTLGYHAVNFLLHAGNAWLMYALARRLLRDARAAFLAAALWAVHPIGTEAVTNIAGRADLLAGMAVLGGLLLYARLEDSQGWRTRVSIAAIFVVATAGVFSKENAVVLLGLMVLWDLCRDTPSLPRGRRAAGYAAVAGSLILLWIVRSTVLGALPSPEVIYVDNPLRATEFFIARWTAIKVIAIDLGLLLWPARLSYDRSYRQIALAGPSDFAAWMAVAVIVALLVAVIVRYRRDRVLFFAAGFFGIAILPTSNLVISIGSIMAERFLYLPSAGFAIAVVALVRRSVSRKVATILLTAAIVLCGSRTFARNFAWHDELTLASTDVQTAPDSFKLHDMLAKSLYDQDPRGNLDQVILEEERAWAILDPLPPHLSMQVIPANLGAYYGAKGDAAGGPRTPEGRAWYEKALTILLRGREISRASEKAFDETQRAAGKALSTRAAYQSLYVNLAAVFLGLGRYVEAGEACRYALGLNPHRIEAYNIMELVWRKMDRPQDGAITAEERGLIEGFVPGTVNRLADLYQKVPEGSCALLQQGGRPQLNLQCPVVARDICAATVELIAAYREARMYAEAGRLANTAASQYACPAQQ